MSEDRKGQVAPEAVIREALDGMTKIGRGWSWADAEVMASEGNSALDRILARLAAAERERDALRRFVEEWMIDAEPEVVAEAIADLFAAHPQPKGKAERCPTCGSEDRKRCALMDNGTYCNAPSIDPWHGREGR